MSDRIRQHLSTVIVALVVGALAGVTSSALAQEPVAKPTTDKPDLTQVFETAGLNADKVDNRHAVAYTTKRGKRAGKLVATNSKGFLPSNILKPQWRVIQNMPAGFRDGKDDRGVTGVTFTHVHEEMAVVAGKVVSLLVSCPTGYTVTGGGFGSGDQFRIWLSVPTANKDAWAVKAENGAGVTAYLHAYAMCVSTTQA